MPTNITDVDEYTATIVAPADGDPVNGSAPEEMGQGLANRTYNHKLRLDALNEYCELTVTGSSLAQDAAATIAISSENGGFAVTGGDSLTLASAGTYLVSFNILVESSDTANPTYVELVPRYNSGVSNMGIFRGYRYSATATDDIVISGVAIFTATSAWTDIQLTLDAGAGETTSVLTGAQKRFCLVRLA